jgi:hypothetical protein
MLFLHILSSIVHINYLGVQNKYELHEGEGIF